VPSTATYKFGISCDDGCSLFVNNVNIANDRGAHRCPMMALHAAAEVPLAYCGKHPSLGSCTDADAAHRPPYVAVAPVRGMRVVKAAHDLLCHAQAFTA